MTTYISMSGIDGAGKSTQIKLLTDHLQCNGISVKVIWARPGSTYRLLAGKSFIRMLSRKVPQPGHSKKRDDLMKTSNIGLIWGWLSLIDVLIEYILIARIYKFKYDYVIFDRFIDDLYIDLKIHLGKNIINKNIKSLIYLLLPKCKKNFFFTISLELSNKRCLEKFEPFPDRVFEKKIRFNEYENFNSIIDYTYIDGALDLKTVRNIVYKELNK